MEEKFIRFQSADNIEMCGVLYRPNIGSKKTVVHVHGLAGNFYENRFVSYLAQMYTSKGYNFLTFNNRGTGYFFDLLKTNTNGEIVFQNGGGAYENFLDSEYDIKGIINYLNKNNIDEEIILQGHSLGCNKVVHYYSKNRNKNISKMILLAPCDIATEIKTFMGNSYNGCVEQAKKLMNEGNGLELIASPLFPLTFSANTFMNDWMPNAEADIFRYRDEKHVNEKLKCLDIPVLIEIGTADDSALVVDKDKVDKYFKNNLNNYKLEYINDAPHNYLNYEMQLTTNIKEWL